MEWRLVEVHVSTLLGAKWIYSTVVSFRLDLLVRVATAHVRLHKAHICGVYGLQISINKNKIKCFTWWQAIWTSTHTTDCIQQFCFQVVSSQGHTYMNGKKLNTVSPIQAASTRFLDILPHKEFLWAYEQWKNAGLLSAGIPYKIFNLP